MEKQALLSGDDSALRQRWASTVSRWLQRQSRLICICIISFINLLYNVLNLLNVLFPNRKMTKEDLAQTSSNITENLMNISRMMAQQVQQSEETMTSLGQWKRRNANQWSSTEWAKDFYMLATGNTNIWSFVNQCTGCKKAAHNHGNNTSPSFCRCQLTFTDETDSFMGETDNKPTLKSQFVSLVQMLCN